MEVSPNCGCSAEQVNLMFRRAEQYIDEQITDRTVQMNRYWVDMYPVKPFPDGVGLILEKWRFFGDIGPQYDGHDGWRQVQITRQGQNAALLGEHDGCGYNWETVGHGMEPVQYSLMQRDLRTQPICVKDIRTFWQYRQTQDLIFQNLTNISANMREQLNRNSAMMFAIKHVALPGLPTNTEDPHQLPVIPAGTEIGKLTYQLLLTPYHFLAQEAGRFAIATIDGMPSFGVVAHPETLHEMVYQDPQLREDLRRCQGTSCDLIKRYNFLDGIGPFVLMPDLAAPRYDRDANGVLSRVFPYDRSLPIAIGTRPVTNPAYHSAEFELVQILTRDLFSLRTRRELTTVGGQTNFDGEVGMFSWKWHNPERCEDPYRRTGRYVATAEIGVEPGDFTDVVSILVKRRPSSLGFEVWGPEPEADTLPAGDCPCPQVIGLNRAIRDDELVIEFDRATGLTASGTPPVSLETPNGSFATGTVQEVSSDEKTVRVRFASDVVAVPGMFVGLLCSTVDFCSAKVMKTDICGILEDTATVTFTVDRLLKLEATETATLNMCDGSQFDADVATSGVSASDLQYTFELDWSDYCAGKGVCSICVPTATDATCPACDAEPFEDCTEED